MFNNGIRFAWVITISLFLLTSMLTQVVDAEVTAKFVDLGRSGGYKVKQNHQWQGRWDKVISTEDSNTQLLLFYDRAMGNGKVFRYDDKGNVFPVLDEKNWSKSWDSIVGGKFGKANVVFYRRGATNGDSGTLRAYRFPSNGGKELAFEQTIPDPYSEKSSFVGWDIVVGGYWGGTAEGLLFYNRTAGRAIIMRYDRSKNRFEKVKSFSGWSRSWDDIATGRFGGTDIISDLVVHDQDTGKTKIVELNNKLAIAAQKPLNVAGGVGISHGARLAVGEFGGSGRDDIVLYQQDKPDRAKGEANGRFIYWTDDSSGKYSSKLPDTSWAPDWTHMVAVHKSVKRGLLLYKNIVHVNVELIRTRASGFRGPEEWSETDSRKLDRWVEAMRRTYRVAGIRFNVIRRPGTLRSDFLNSYPCTKNEDSDLNRKNANDWVARNIASNRIAVFLRPHGKGCSSRKANFVIAGGGNTLGSTKHLAHEVGHFLGLPHSFIGVGSPEELKEKLNSVEVKVKRSPRFSDLDSDRMNPGNFLSIRDTLPLLNAKYFTKQKLKPCQHGGKIVIQTSAGSKVTILRDAHNVMGYISCNNLFRLSADQIRAVRQDLHTNRKRLLAPTVAVVLKLKEQ